MPSDPGDLSAAIRFSDSKGKHDNSKGEDEPEIPLSLRTLIPVGPTGGSFTGTLTGGNGRAGVGPYQTYEFDVPSGRRHHESESRDRRQRLLARGRVG